MTLDMYIEKLLVLKEEHGGDLLLVERDDNYELRGNFVQVSKYKTINVSIMKKEKRNFVDSFDGTRYSCDVYIDSNENDRNAIKVIQI